MGSEEKLLECGELFPDYSISESKRQSRKWDDRPSRNVPDGISNLLEVLVTKGIFALTVVTRCAAAKSENKPAHVLAFDVRHR